MNATQQQQVFVSKAIEAAFTLEAKKEIGADEWFLIVSNGNGCAFIVTETGALCRLSLSYDHTVNGTLTIEDEFTMSIAARATVLHSITEAQRARVRQYKQAKGKARQEERYHLRVQLYALRMARQWFDHLVKQAEPINL
jgi:hypothetical protein